MPQTSFSRLDYKLMTMFLAFLALGLLAALMLPPAVDWHEVYRPAALALLSGQNPYQVGGFLNPPWALFPLLPFALLPERIGRGLLFVTGLMITAWVAVKFGGNKSSLLPFLLSPPVIQGLYHGNIDWLVILGFTLPSSIGLFFIILKPQLGIGLAIYWFLDSFRKKGIAPTIQLFLPATIAVGLSFALFGFYPSQIPQGLITAGNASLWPASLPLGLVFLVKAIRESKIEYSLVASPLLSPYVILHSWVGALLALVRHPFEMWAAVLGLWLLILIQTAGYQDILKLIMLR